MYLTWQTIVTVASIVAAFGALLGYFVRIHNWYLKQNKQDEEISAIKTELKVMMSGILACLKGLQEQGCDGPVTSAIASIEAHLISSAHK